MRRLKRSALMLGVLVGMLSGHAVSGQSTQVSKSSAENLPSSGTRVEGGAASDSLVGRLPEKRSFSAYRAAKPQKELGAATEKQSFSARPGVHAPEGLSLSAQPQGPVKGCNAAVEELKASRRLIGLLEQENSLLKERLETERRSASLLAELNETRRAEGAALRNVVAAKNETIFAKDAVIANQEKVIESLKAKKSSPWKRVGDVLIGMAAGALLR